ncbi:MAG TPA: glycosyltransferase [Candidatus Eremiobacteraeota bacterium]|nr:MAG: Processive diacylglycerol beta-glucosyltransferase [bacterium ADurb.Bin363]HPZ09045.1 glycosyltransferase [Candidatus Eremiobacteraeota bacterium]
MKIDFLNNRLFIEKKHTLKAEGEKIDTFLPSDKPDDLQLMKDFKKSLSPHKPVIGFSSELIEALEKLPPKDNIKIFLVHGSHTGGHRSAAESLKAVFDKLPHVEAEVINSLDYSSEGIKNAQVGATQMAMDHLKSLRGWCFQQSHEGNPLMYWLGNTGMKIKSFFSKKFLTKIQKEKPDVVISTHSPMNSMLSYWKKSDKMDMPLLSCVTDFSTHRMWAQSDVDHYYVATDGASRDLKRFHIDDSKISVTGIPIKPDFAGVSKIPSVEMKKKLGLDPDKPLVLLMGGSLGYGPYEELSTELDKLDKPLQIVAICGKNQAKCETLEKKKDSMKHTLLPLGFIKNVNDYMEAADVIISKPGGLTASEIFALKKPMVILEPKPGLEEISASAIQKLGVAFMEKTPEDAAGFVQKLLTDPSLKEEVDRRLEDVSHPYSSYAVAEDAVRRALEYHGKSEK